MKQIHISAFIFTFTYLVYYFFNTQPFWGLMDDPTSIKTSIQFKEKPLITTYEWLSHHNKNGMFRPFFPLQQFIQFSFYDFKNPLPSFLLNIFIVLFGLFLFSKLFVKKENIILFYSIYLLWPYAYDWLFLPALNSKWGLIISCIALLINEQKKTLFLKFILGMFSVLMKLNVVILLPIIFYYEKINNKKLSVTIGMGVGLLIQLIFFFSYPNSYYNTGIIETVKTINFFTIQNLFVFLILLTQLIDLFFLKNSKNEKLLILCVMISIFFSLGILNLRNSNFAYLGALLVFPISLYSISLGKRIFSFINTKSLNILLLLISIIISNIFFLTPRLQRWNDIGNLITQEYEGKVVYFCSEGQKMLNIWDKELNDKNISFFNSYKDQYEKTGLWLNEHRENFRFIKHDESIEYSSAVYIIDPYCEVSVDFYNNNLANCELDFIYNNEIKIVTPSC